MIGAGLLKPLGGLGSGLAFCPRPAGPAVEQRDDKTEDAGTFRQTIPHGVEQLRAVQRLMSDDNVPTHGRLPTSWLLLVDSSPVR